jgi:hypothetical protein
MGIYSIAESVIKHGVKRLQYVTPSCHVGTANELGIPLEKLVGDTVLIKHKSPLNEFMSYIQNVAREGKSYKPTFENPDSAFAKYWEAIENWNKEAVREFREDFSKIETNKGNEGSIVYLNSDKMSICDHSKLFA